jgi:hypothetical protein
MMLSKDVYVIVDKKRKFIVHTNPNNSKIVCEYAILQAKDSSLKVLTYDTEGRAKSGLRESRFHEICKMEKHYPELLPDKPGIRNKEAWLAGILRTQLEVVKVKLTISEYFTNYES